MRQIQKDAYLHFRELGDTIRFNKTEGNNSYDIIRGALTKYAYNRVGKDWMDAEDCMQDAYVSTLSTAKVNEHYNFYGLYKIWLDRAIRDKNKEKRNIASVITEDKPIDEEHNVSLIDLAESEDPSVESLFDTQINVNEIMEKSDRLRPKTKAIIRLFMLFGYTYKEIEEMLKVTPKQIENAVGYFRKSLRGNA